MLRPLFLAYPEDTATYAQDDEVLCGDALLVAPITRPGSEYRHVYLPEGNWFHFWTGERIAGRPTFWLIPPGLGQPAFYVRANTAIPLWPEMNYVGQEQADPLTLLLYPCAGHGQAALYEDAGDGYEHVNGAYARRTIICEVEAGTIHVLISAQEGTFVLTRQRLQFELREASAAPQVVRSGKDLISWQYHPDRRTLVIELQETPEALELLIEP